MFPLFSFVDCLIVSQAAISDQTQTILNPTWSDKEDDRLKVYAAAQF